MKIGIFSDCYYPQINGVITSISTLKKALEKRGHKVYIITVKVPNSKDSSDESIIRIPSIHLRKIKGFRLGIPVSLKIFQRIKDLNLDIIHTQTEFSVGMFGLAIGLQLDIPLIHTYHTMYEDYTHFILQSDLMQPFLKKTVRKTSKFIVNEFSDVIAPSNKTKKALIEYGVDSNIHVIPTGIDINNFSRLEANNEKLLNIREKLGLNGQHKILLSLGRVSQEKDIDFLINAMPKIYERDKNIHLIVVGEGPAVKSLQDLTEKLSMDSHIHFIGAVPYHDVASYYSLADVFVNASKSETQGLTILEAMASRLPVIVYADENILDIIEDNQSGKLFTSQDQYVDAVFNILYENKNLEAIVENAHKIAKSLSPDIFGENIEAVYMELIESKKNYHASQILK